MQLREWINQHPVTQRRAIREMIGDVVGVSEVAVRHWANNIRRVPGPYCIPIEELLNGQVTRYELRPDIFGPLPQPTPLHRRQRQAAL